MATGTFQPIPRTLGERVGGTGPTLLRLLTWAECGKRDLVRRLIFLAPAPWPLPSEIGDTIYPAPALGNEEKLDAQIADLNGDSEPDLIVAGTSVKKLPRWPWGTVVAFQSQQTVIDSHCPGKRREVVPADE